MNSPGTHWTKQGRRARSESPYLRKSSDATAGRMKISSRERTAERPRTEAASSTGRTSCSSSLTSRDVKRAPAKKLQYTRSKGFLATRAGKRYDEKNFAAKPTVETPSSRGPADCETAEECKDDPIALLRREISDWRAYEMLTSAVQDKLTRIENARGTSGPPSCKSHSAITAAVASHGRSHENVRRRDERIEAQPEPGPRQNVIRQQKLPPGRTSRCAVGGQTTGGPDKRAVDSHVRTRSAGRSSPRGAWGNRSSPANDRVGGMKNLKDYLPRPRKKTPVKISESPILSPDTLDALEKAESLVKEAQKTILEASYDIASSPEREQSARSGQKTEDEDALYIRDIVALRFYEANESARIFTRPSARPLAERICRPIARPRRARRAREKSTKIRSEVSTTLRPTTVQVASKDLQRDSKISRDQRQKEPGKHSHARRATYDEEIPKRIPKDTSESSHPWRMDNQNVANSFGVQQGPRVDIRNELTTTSVEKVVISPRPRSSLPAQRNIKTYEFQHESCVEKIVDVTTNATSEKARSTEAPIGDDVAAARDSLETPEKSPDPIRKSCGFAAAVTMAPQIQGSRSDLVENKSGRSIPAERLEGHTDNVCTGIPERVEHVSRRNDENIDDKENERNAGNTENRAECLMDFFRRSGNSGKVERTENLKHNVFGRLDTNDKINIFDRAVDQFLDEFGREERGEVRANLPENETNINLLKDSARELDNLVEEEFLEGEYFEDNWDPEEINLPAPNFGHFDKTLRKFDCTIDKVLRGTRSLDVIISEYNSEKGIVTQASLANRNRPCNARLFYSEPTKDIPEELGLKNIDHPRKKAMDNREKRGAEETTKDGEELISSREYCNESTAASRYYTETRREVAKKLPTEGESSSGRYDNHPRFSTPLNNDLKITRPERSKANCKSNEFARFLIGIQRPTGLFESKEASDRTNVDFARFENPNEGKIVLNRNELTSAQFKSAVTRNDLEAQKKNVFDENNGKCSVNAPYDGDQLSTAEHEEKTHETQTFPNYPTGEKVESFQVRNSGTRSLMQDSAIGQGTDRSDGISVGTKLIDECNAKKESSRSEQCTAPERDSTGSNQSATKKDAQASQLEAVHNKNVESGGTKTLTLKNSSVPCAEKAQNSEKKLSAALQSADVAKTSNHENEHAVKGKGTTSEKNRHADSPGSSLKDRTSFDVSTVYSEDFEELAASDEKSKAKEKSESSKSAGLKSIENRPEAAAAAKLDVDDNKKSDSKTALTSSLQSSEMEKLHEESKKEALYLDKSVSTSVSKLSGKIEEYKRDGNDGSREVELVAEEKGTVECNSEIKEADKFQPEELEKPCGEKDAASTSASAKVSGTSSIVGESRREETNVAAAAAVDTCSENYSEGELYLPSSCSYSLGEIRISERGSCGTVGPVIQSSAARNADGMRIYLGKITSTLRSSSNALGAHNSPARSPGEVQETDAESISSSRSATSEGEHRMVQRYALQIKPIDT